MVTTKEVFGDNMDILEGVSVKDIKNAKALYEYIVMSGAKANYLNEGLDDKVDEGLLSGLLGATAGNLIGPAIGRALCKVLGINENGTLGKLLNSKLVTTAMGFELGR